MARRTVNNPNALLNRFAALLGWPPLRVYRQRIADDPNTSEPCAKTWYESGECGNPRMACFLQINETDQAAAFEGAVYAIRYRICTGWHPFALDGSEESLVAEAARLDGWLGRRWFESPAMRRRFRELRPECTGYTWHRVRTVKPPRETPPQTIPPIP